MKGDLSFMRVEMYTDLEPISMSDQKLPRQMLGLYTSGTRMKNQGTISTSIAFEANSHGHPRQKA